MKLSTKTTYSLRALLCLAKIYPQGLSVKAVAAAESLPAKYLESLLSHLKNLGFLTAKKGVGGGYCLARPPASIKIGRLIIALEGNWSLAACRTGGVKHGCSLECNCGVSQLTARLSRVLNAELNRISLRELL